MQLKSHQVLGNQLLLAEKSGMQVPEGIDWSNPEHISELRKQQPQLWHQYSTLVKERVELRQSMSRILEEALSNPGAFGVENLDWRASQSVLLSDLSWSLRHGYSKLAAKLPTGGGKTHVEGAIARSALEALGSSQWGAIEILALTSRTNLVHQLSRGNQAVAGPESEGLGDGLNLGDLTRWLSQILTADQIRVLAGNAPDSERQKGAVVTIGTYQGLNEERIRSLHSQREVLLIICDEMHNLTDRIRRLILTNFPGAMLTGLSATPQGPQRSPFLAFEEVHRPGRSENGSWQQNLASRQELSDLIHRRELKPLRLLSSQTDISFAEVGHEGGELNDSDVARVLTRNIPLLQQFLERLFNTSHQMLRLAGSRQPRERTWVAFVNRITIATELSRYCSQELGLPATVLSGEDSATEFEDKCSGLRSGEYRIAFSCKKAGEGLDVREIDGVLSLAPHGLASEWLLEQEIGRGLRSIPDRPYADCLVVEPHYEDDPGLASTSRILRQPDFMNGGLLVPGALREAEMIVVRLLREGSSLAEALEQLTDEQRELLLTQWGMVEGQGGPGGGGPSGLDPRENLELDVTFIHRDDVHQLVQAEDPALRLAHAREIMIAVGIPDRRTFLQLGVAGCWQITFGDIGGLSALYSYVVGRSLGRGVNVTLSHLNEIADATGLPEVSEATRNQWILALQSAGIPDRRSLKAVGVNEFKRKTFGNFGGAVAFYAAVMGRTIQRGEGFSLSHANEIADAVGLPEIAEESIVRWREELLEAGIPDRRTLWYFGVASFETKIIGCKGAKAFCSEVTGVTESKQLTVVLLEQVADITQLPELATETLTMLHACMVDAGIPDRRTLQELGKAGCNAKQFGSLGGVKSFYAYVTGKRLGREKNLGLPELKEIADILNLPELSEQTKNRARIALQRNGVGDRRMLQWHGADGFWRMQFEGIGGGQALYTLITGKSLQAKLSPPNLDEIAEILSLPEISSQTQELWRAALAEHGISDRQSLYAIGSSAFKKKKFGIFKGATAFYSLLTGKSLKQDGCHLRPDHLPEIADAVGFS